MVTFLSASFWEVSMFDSLDEQIRKDEDRVAGGHNARMMKYALYALAGAAVFGALLLGVHFAGG
jgi:hypothetical protein